MVKEITGYLYQQDRSVKDDAANIRRTIKTLTKAGLLPADWAYSVRYRTASMMEAIDVRATCPRTIWAVEDPSPGQATNTETGQIVYARVDKMTIEARTVETTLTDLLEGHNHTLDHAPHSRALPKFYGDVYVRSSAA